MVRITISDDLAQAIADAESPITLVDSRGRTLGQLTPMHRSDDFPEVTPERRAEIERRLQEPGEYVPFETIKERLGW